MAPRSRRAEPADAGVTETLEDEAPGQAGEPGPVKSAQRVLLILDLLTEHQEGLTFAEVGQALGLPKSSAFGLLRTMVGAGYLMHDASSRRFRIGMRCWEAGQAFIRSLDLVKVSRPFLASARDRLGETVQLAVLDGWENVYLAKVEANHRLALVSHVGGRLPAYSTGLGKVLLASLDDSTVRSRLQGVPFHRFTAHTIRNTRDLIGVLAEIRSAGYATDRGEYTEGVFCVAVPVRDHTSDVVAAISVSVPDVRVTPDTEPRLVKVLRDEAANISHALGYRDEA
jgi:DNA-binding IclR family transcriptional regulator